MGQMMPRLEAHEMGGKRDIAHTITFLPIINFYRLSTDVPAEAIFSGGLCVRNAILASVLSRLCALGRQCVLP